MGEDRGERLDRELGELLQELRVALPGVQVLFAFLLTVPFSDRFGRVTGLDRGAYFAATVCTALASILFIAPTAYHRLRFRQYDKERMMVTSNRLAIAGSVFLAAAIAAVMFLVSDMMFGGLTAALIAAAVAALLAWFWFGLPLMRPDRG
jgi:O-antigen/teichoic acid export membrane protein